ncbi:MAG: hypothetical protein M1503_02305 [Thaumarchaeota archaeon]|nr:hypothetical protein [Nitrososphaerota archaeon]MCL5317084.1 hypothetical protein [Nitrososphaerota archaeon]
MAEPKEANASKPTSKLTESTGRRVHTELLLLGFVFFLFHILARYYTVQILVPRGAVTTSVITLRDSLLQMGVLVSAVGIILPSIKFKKDEEQIVAYVFSLGAIALMLGTFLSSVKSPAAIYVLYNAGAITLLMLLVLIFGFLGFRGKRFSLNETDRIAMAVLVLMLVVNVAVLVWSFSVTLAGRAISANLDILRDHSARYAAWMVLAAFIMRFSKPSDKFYRRILGGLIVTVIFWVFTFGLYATGVKNPVTNGAMYVAGVMDGVLGLLVLATLLGLLGFKGVRGRMTPHFTIGGVSLIWFIIAGAIGLYMTTFFSASQQPVPAGWRVFHLVNANWALIAAFGAVALASTNYPKRIGQVLLILFTAEMAKTVIVYFTNVINPTFANASLIPIGEPFFLISFIIIIYLLTTKPRRTGIIEAETSETETKPATLT